MACSLTYWDPCQKPAIWKDFLDYRIKNITAPYPQHPRTPTQPVVSIAPITVWYIIHLYFLSLLSLAYELQESKDFYFAYVYTLKVLLTA